MTSAARDLMDTGTPGPWTEFVQHGRDYTDEGYSIVGVTSAAHDIALTYPTGTEHDEHESDARKIVLSVNALPLVDALCEATREHVRYYGGRNDCASCDHPWPCPTSAARDALEAALRGEGDG